MQRERNKETKNGKPRRQANKRRTKEGRRKNKKKKGGRRKTSKKIKDAVKGRDKLLSGRWTGEGIFRKTSA